jgi:hypothetical protein
MLIFLLTLVVLALAGATGFLQGALRSLITLLGVILGAFLARPLGVHLNPLMPKIGLENPVWAWFVPPVIVFVLFVLVFMGIAFAVHRQVALFFKYKTDEYQMQSWERMNKRVGVSIGLFIGSIYTVLLCVGVYSMGYLTSQVATGENDPAALRFVSAARKDMQATGMDKIAARLDPMKEEFYMASDIVGLLHRNPLLEARMADYPFFLSIAERAEFKELASDKEFQSMREKQPTLVDLLNHPKVIPIIGSEELLDILRQIDLKDLKGYLQTGKSAKYDEEKILGRWRLDPTPTIRELRRLSPDMTPAEFAQAKRMVNMMAPLVNLTSSPDNKFSLQVNVAELAKQVTAMAAAVAPQAAAAPVVIAQPPPQPETGAGMSSQMMQRYGIKRGGSPTPQPAQPVIIGQAPATRPAAPKAQGKFAPMAMIGQAAEGLEKAAAQQPVMSVGGSWSRDGDKYTLKVADPSGKEHEVEGTADDERMHMTIPILPPLKLTLVFFRV